MRRFALGLGTLVVVIVTSIAYLGAAEEPPQSRIVFTSTRDGNEDIFSMNPDGTAMVNLTPEHAGGRLPGRYQP